MTPFSPPPQRNIFYGGKSLLTSFHGIFYSVSNCSLSSHKMNGKIERYLPDYLSSLNSNVVESFSRWKIRNFCKHHVQVEVDIHMLFYA